MSGLYVNVEEMNKNGEEILNKVQAYSSEVKSLNDNIQELKKIWTGDSAQEFFKAFEEQLNNLEQFRKLLYNLGSGVIQGADILNRANN